MSVPVENELDITYAAHTASCTFLLDADGVCRAIVMSPHAKRRDTAKTAARCVGAQYVASLDGATPGCLVEMPRVGIAMLFARVDERGRVSLVRTGPVTAFEHRTAPAPAHDPFDSLSVMTSAPEVTPRVTPHEEPDPDYLDSSERTQPLIALRPEYIKHRDSRPRPPPSVPRASPDESQELPTREVPSPSVPAPSAPRRPPSLAPTLRNPPRESVVDDEGPYRAAPITKRWSSSQSAPAITPSRPSRVPPSADPRQPETRVPSVVPPPDRRSIPVAPPPSSDASPAAGGRDTVPPPRASDWVRSTRNPASSQGKVAVKRRRDG